MALFAATWLETTLAGFLPEVLKPCAPWLAVLLFCLAVLGALLNAVAIGIFVERKVAGAIQNRHGPNRVGPWGLFQPIADGLKPLLKEDVIPRHVQDKVLFLLAPGLAAAAALAGFAVVPFGPTNPAGDSFVADGPTRFIIGGGMDIGLLYIFAVGSLAVYAPILGGWSSNTKYSFLGALRSSAQLVSYEIPLGLAVLGVILMSGTLNLERIVEQQAAGTFLFGWNVWTQPLAFLLFMCAALAEAQRLPFDLSECEQELVGGYHTEYSAMKFAMFMLGEYIHMIAVAFLCSILFFGGWHFPLIAAADSSYPFHWLVKVGVLASKAVAFVLLFMFIRWTIPRFRYDQLMGLAWKTMLPLALLNLLCVLFVRQFDLPTFLLLPASVGLFVGAGWFHARHAQTRLAALPAAGGA